MKFKFIFFFLIIFLCISVVSADDNITLNTQDLVKFYNNDSQFECRLESSSEDVSNREINFNINNVSYTRHTNELGNAKFNINLGPGKYSITTTFGNISKTNSITVLSTILSDNLTKYFCNGSQFSVCLLDGQGRPTGDMVYFNINGIIYIRPCNEGVATLNINLPVGEYIITTHFNGLAISNKITVLTYIESDNLVKYYQNSSNFIVKVLDKRGRIVSGGVVSFNINGIFYNRTTNADGIAKFNINLPPGDYIITTIYDNLVVSNNVSVLSFLKTDNLVKYYQNSSNFVVKVLDKRGAIVSGGVVSFNINGIFYNRTTNADGIAKFNINLPPGDYIITTFYDNLAIGNTVVVLSRLISSGDIFSIYGSEEIFTVKLVSLNGKAMANKQITFNIGGELFKKTTTVEGIASINLNLKSGKYIISYSGDGVIGSNNIEIKNKVDLNLYTWGGGADVTRNTLINKYLPRSDLIREIVNKANSGIPMVTFKGGTGKKVFITAGAHGNELSSQLAALNLITYLENNPIDGTVYIMPFVNPKATAANVRNYNGVNLNAVADRPGTVSNNIIKLIISLGCDCYGDFHCTQPGGSPGRDVVMGTYAPTRESAVMVEEISRITGMSKMFYNVAGSSYVGAFEDTANLNGIPAVTCEVLTHHGTIAIGSVDRSISFMKALLKYAKVIS